MLRKSVSDVIMNESTPRICFQTPVACEDSLFFSCFQDSAMWVSSCFLTWDYSAALWPVSRLCFQALVEAPPCSAWAFSGLLESLKPCREFSLALKKIVRHQIHRSWSRHHQIQRFRLRHSRTFSRIAFSKIAFLSSLWHGALHSVLKKEMAAREHREIHDIQQTKKMIPLITCESSFG